MMTIELFDSFMNPLQIPLKGNRYRIESIYHSSDKLQTFVHIVENAACEHTLVIWAVRSFSILSVRVSGFLLLWYGVPNADVQAILGVCHDGWWCTLLSWCIFPSSSVFPGSVSSETWTELYDEYVGCKAVSSQLLSLTGFSSDIL